MNFAQRALCLTAFFLPATLSAFDGMSGRSALPEVNPFLDPAFHAYVETAYGYLNPQYAPGRINDFRDSPISPAADRARLLSPAVESMRSKAPFPRPSVRTAEGAGDTIQASVKQPPAGASAPAARSPKNTGQHYKVTFVGESGPLSSFVNPLSSGAMSGFNVENYAFISVLPKTGNGSAAIAALAADGFRFTGEKTYFTTEGKKTFLLGWAPYASLDRIYKNPLVLRSSVETKSSSAPFRARVRFTLRAPSGGSPADFVENFIRNLGSSSGFYAENILRIPNTSGSSKFTAFEITGSLPVDMLNSVSRSPFVAAMELQDKSL